MNIGEAGKTLQVGCQPRDPSQPVPYPHASPLLPQNNIVEDDSGRLVYTNPRGELELLTQERLHRGPNWRVGEPEPEMRVRS